MYAPPNFVLNHCVPLNIKKGIFLTLNGNANMVIRIPKDPDSELAFNTKEVDIGGKLIDDVVWYLVDGGAGTTKGIGKTGDITKVGIGKMEYIAITKTKSDDVPENSEVYNYTKIVRPDRFVLMIINTAIKIDATIEVDNNGDRYLHLALYNIPVEGITLPTMITDSFTNWLAYWFSSEGVARRFKEPRNKPTKFKKAHHRLSDVYITTNMDTYKPILVAIYNNKSPSKALVFSRVQDSPDVDFKIVIHEYDMVTETMTYLSCMGRYTGWYDIENLLNTAPEFSEYTISTAPDKKVFEEYFHKWVYVHSYSRSIGGRNYV